MASMRNTITKNVEKAFRLAGDLVVRADFIKKTEKTFDFGTSAVNEVPESVTNVGVLFIDIVQKDDGKNTHEKEVYVRTRDIGALDQYDSMITNESIWKIGNAILANDYIIIFKALRT